MKCWGANANGQLGDSSGTQRLIPVAIRSGQSISFVPPATAITGTTLLLTASASSGLTTTAFDTWTPATCSISGTTLSFTGAAGSLCGVRASQPGLALLPSGGSVAPAPQQLRLIQITQAISTTRVSSSLNPSSFGANVTLTALVTGTTTPLPTGTVTFMDGTSILGTASLNASASASYVSTALTVGSHSVTASYGGDGGNAASASTGTLTQVVNTADQVIAFGSVPSLSVGGTTTVSATGGDSGNAVTFTSSTTSICTVIASSGVINAVAAGNCIIAADQSGNSNYSTATQVTQIIVVNKANQTISGFTPTTPVAFGTAAQTLTAVKGASSSPLVFSVTSGPCTLSTATLSYTGAGSCVVVVNQAADTNYNAAASVSATVVVTQANQNISFGTAPTLAVGTTGIAIATATSNLAVNFSTTTSSTCTVNPNSGLISATAAGSCIITADQAGSNNYNAAAQVLQTMVVAKGTQTISGFTPATPVAFGAIAQTLSAVKGASISPLVFSVTSGPCTLSSLALSYTGAGSCVVAVNQVADTNYNTAATVSATVVVTPASQSISFSPVPTLAVGGMGTASATATSNLAVSFSTTSSTCAVNASSGVINATAAGTCVIKADQAGNNNYNAATQAVQSITVTQAISTTTLITSAASTVFGQSATFTASTTSNNASRTGTVAFTDSGAALPGCAAVVLTVTNNSGQASCLISSLSVNSHAITATYSGDANTTGSANATAVNVTVNKASTAVSVTSPTAISLGNSATVTATVAVQSPGAGSLTGTVLISDATVTCSFVLPATRCSLTPTSAGSKTLTVTYTPDAAATVNFTTSSSSGSFTVNASAPSSTLASSANPNVYGQSLTLTATMTAAAGGQRAAGTVAFTDGGSSIAGCTAQPLTAGSSASSATATCVMAAASSLTAGSHALSMSFAGDGNNTASSASLSQNITLAGQTIVFGSPPMLVYQGSAALTATGGASGSPVIFSSTTPSVCTVSGVTVTDVIAGSCIVAANQAGNSNYSAAPQVTQSFMVARVSSQSTLSSSPGTPSSGQSLTLRYSVTQVAGGSASNAASSQLKSVIAPTAVLTGTVTFSDNGVVLATVTLDANGQASYTIAALSSGSHSFTAVYSGDSLVAPSAALMVLEVAAVIVPTLSGWMLLLLTLLLGVAALRVRLRRN